MKSSNRLDPSQVFPMKRVPHGIVRQSFIKESNEDNASGKTPTRTDRPSEKKMKMSMWNVFVQYSLLVKVLPPDNWPQHVGTMSRRGLSMLLSDTEFLVHKSVPATGVVGEEYLDMLFAMILMHRNLLSNSSSEIHFADFMLILHAMADYVSPRTMPKLERKPSFISSILEKLPKSSRFSGIISGSMPHAYFTFRGIFKEIFLFYTSSSGLTWGNFVLLLRDFNLDRVMSSNNAAFVFLRHADPEKFPNVITNFSAFWKCVVKCLNSISASSELDSGENYLLEVMTTQQILQRASAQDGTNSEQQLHERLFFISNCKRKLRGIGKP